MRHYTFIFLLIFTFIVISIFGSNIPVTPFKFDGNKVVIDYPITINGVATFTENVIANVIETSTGASYLTVASIPENASFSFAFLNDVATRTGQANKVFKVKADETGYEWGNVLTSFPRETITLSQASTTLTSTLPLSSAMETILTFNGIMQEPNVDYFVISSNTISLSGLLATNTKIHLIKLN